LGEGTGGAEVVNFSRLSFQRAMVGVKLGLEADRIFLDADMC
jgi:hypothetical protein